MNDMMRERGAVVNSAAQAMSSGLQDLETFPLLIIRIIDEEMWRQRAIPQRRWELSREFTSFKEFVESPPLDGLNTRLDILKDLCKGNTVAIDAIDRAGQRPNGGDRRTSETIRVNIVNSDPRPMGNTQAQAIRRLRDQRPDLHSRVLAQELSAHAAMVEAGFRERVVQVPVANPERAARALQRAMEPEVLRQLISILRKEVHGHG